MKRYLETLFGMTVEDYEIIVKQQTVFSVTHTIIVAIVFILSVILLFIGLKRDVEVYFIACSIGFIMGFIWFTATITQIVTGFLNPEYNAIREIGRFITS